MPPGPGQQQRFHECGIENKGGQMSTSVLYMSMSLDGYIAGPNDEVGNAGGDGFDRLLSWAHTPGGEALRSSGEGGQMMDEGQAIGGVLAGRRRAGQAGWYGVANRGGDRV